MNNKDKPLFEKFNSKSVLFDSDQEFLSSILDEIDNIISTRLKLRYERGLLDNPFAYGIRDLQSIDISSESLENFKLHCQKAILASEPRITNIEIVDVKVNNENQAILFDMLISLKDNKFEKKFSIIR
ncbi:MAG: GPW/gp25 family protein [Holosporales bacterium]|jgi:predicted component of type VI protein secretion system|nr:GPW/gp25 family protein [Holosporales bacterium]